MAQKGGHLIYVKFGNSIIECLTTSNVKISKAEVNKTTQCSGGWAESDPGQGSWEVGVNGRFDPTLTKNAKEIVADILAGTVGEAYWGLIEVGGFYLHGSAWFSEVSMDANHETQEKVTFSATLKGTGAIAVGTATTTTTTTP